MQTVSCALMENLLNGYPSASCFRYLGTKGAEGCLACRPVVDGEDDMAELLRIGTTGSQELHEKSGHQSRVIAEDAAAPRAEDQRVVTVLPGDPEQLRHSLPHDRFDTRHVFRLVAPHRSGI